MPFYHVAHRWDMYYHTGTVPTRPTAVQAMIARNLPNRRQTIEWIVDSGAACHSLNSSDAQEQLVRVKPVAPYPLQGVGGSVTVDHAGEVILRELGEVIEAGCSDTPFNLLSMARLCSEHGLCFMWFGDLDIPPYILLRGRQFAVVLYVCTHRVMHDTDPLRSLYITAYLCLLL